MKTSLAAVLLALVEALTSMAGEDFRLLKEESRAGYRLRVYELYPDADLAVSALVLIPERAKIKTAAIFMPEDTTSIEGLAGELDPYASPNPAGGRLAYFAALQGSAAVALARPGYANGAPDDVDSEDSRKRYLALLPGSGWTDEALIAREVELCKRILTTIPAAKEATVAFNPPVTQPTAAVSKPPQFTGRRLATGKRMMHAADYEPERADGRTAKTMTWAMLKLRAACSSEMPEFLRDRESFLKWQREYLAPYRKCLAEVPENPEFVLLKEERREGYTLKTYEFYPYKGLAMKTMILYPDNAQPGKTPVVVCMPGGGGSLECLSGEKDAYYNRYPIRNRQCWYYVKCGMIAVALTNHSTANYCADDWSLWSAVNMTLAYWKRAGFRREDFISRSVAMCINFLKHDARVDRTKIACSGLSRGASVIYGALGNPDVKALNYNDFVLNGLHRRMSITELPSGETVGGDDTHYIWMAMAPTPMLLNEGGQYHGVIDEIKRAYELLGHPENLTVHYYDRYRDPRHRKYDDAYLCHATGLTVETHFEYCNVDAYDHSFHPESALPWLNGLFFGRAEIPATLEIEILRARAEREKSAEEFFPPDGQAGRKANGPKTVIPEDELKPERADGRTERTTTWAKMLCDELKR